jgi:hypothetical protein
MKSLYAQYIHERENIETFETESYFFTHKVIEDELHIYEIFVVPEQRHTMATKEMMDRIELLANEKRVKYIVSTVIPGTNNAEKSMLVQFRYGMKLLRSEENKIYLVKELKHG